MEDEKKVEGVKVDETDWEAKYLETQANLDKVAAERENYKKVALSKKGKSSDDDEETEEERVARIVREQLHDTTATNLLREKDEIVKRALQENKELKVALKNRAQVGTSATAGGGQSTSDVRTDFWTAEQLAYFKKRGIDPEKAKENYLKLKNN